MAHYLVTARATGDLAELRARLDSGEIRDLRPFGRALHASLTGARVEGERVVWEELDHCTPPLAMERAAVLDRYFVDIATESVREGEGWSRIEHLPPFWSDECADAADPRIHQEAP